MLQLKLKFHLLFKGKYNFAAKLAIKLQENLEEVEEKITKLGGANKLKEPIETKKAAPSAPKSAPPPVPKTPKPKDVFSTVKIRSQLAKVIKAEF